jgi:hypothetical protein
MVRLVMIMRVLSIFCMLEGALQSNAVMDCSKFKPFFFESGSGFGFVPLEKSHDFVYKVHGA